MEGTFWSTLLAFAPLWAWMPLGIVQLILLIGTNWPLGWSLLPTYVYVLSFVPFLWGWFGGGDG